MRARVLDDRVPFLGICIGLQVLFERSGEGRVDCLGWLQGEVQRFSDEQRVPQIGWNEVRLVRDHPVTADLPAGAHCYFVNSYYAVPTDPADVVGVTDYGVEFCSIVAPAQRARDAVPRGEERRARPAHPARLRRLGRHRMLTKRLIACFDVVEGRVTKAQQFQDNIDVAPAADLGRQLYDDQIDEIVFYDIMASAERRKIDLDTVRGSGSTSSCRSPSAAGSARSTTCSRC